MTGAIKNSIFFFLPPNRFKLPVFSRSSHKKFYQRFYIVWATKHHYKVLQESMCDRIYEINMQTCVKLWVQIVKGVSARDHVHMFLSIPPTLSLLDIIQRIKSRISRRIQMEFPELRKRYWGKQFWACGYFSKISEM